MPNDYFKFKQFLIKQDRCAMKVCTDSCLFGAWIPTLGKHAMLDIGTGTGLLSLMIAQRSTARIDALEIDPQARQQALENVKNSPWSSQVRVLEGDFKEFFQKQTRETYDLIVCNPPFYEKHLKTADHRVNIARHSEHLQAETLMEGSAKLLKEEGELFLLLPAQGAERYSAIGKATGIVLAEMMEVRNRAEGKTFRWMLRLKKTKEKIVCVQKGHLVIRESDRKYSPEFIKYLAPYYLAL